MSAIGRAVFETCRFVYNFLKNKEDGMKYLIALVTAVVLSGCATQANFQSKMDGFIGQPESTVVGTYGPPISSYVMNDGSKVLQYTRGNTVVMPGVSTIRPVTTNTSGNLTLNQGMRNSTGAYSQTSTTYVQEKGENIPLHFSCTVNFTIDKDGIVRRWAAEGNHCVSK